MARASTPAVLNAEIDGRSVGLFVGEDGGVYTRLNGRQRRVANGVCAVPVGAREASGIAQGVYWSAERIPVKHLNQRPTLYWPNRHRHEPWAPDDAWLEDEEEYRHLEQRARRPRPPKLPNLPMVWEEVPTVRRRIALQARDLELFRHLARFGVEVSTRIAYEFFAGRDLTACQRRLKALAEGGYLARGRPQLSRGSVPYVYRLTAAGFEAGQAHHDAEGDPFIPTDRKWTGRVGGGAQSLEHDLRGGGAVMELLDVSQTLGYEAEPLGPAEARCDVPTSYDSTERRHHRITASEFGLHGIHELRLGFEFRDVVPDGGLRVFTSSGRPREIFVEFDRTARPSKNAAKLRGYDSFLALWWRRCDRLAGCLQPVVLFVCTSETVVDSFLDLAVSELTGWRKTDGDRRTYPGRGSLGFCVEDGLYEDRAMAAVHLLSDRDEHVACELRRLIEVKTQRRAERQSSTSRDEIDEPLP